MVIFDRKEEFSPVNFDERATEMERQHCWTEAAYYQQLAKRSNSVACKEHANKLLQRHALLS